MSRVHNFSPTQYEAFVNTCKRYWHGRWILRWPVPEQEFQKFGKGVHKGIENRTNSGVITPETPEIYRPFIEVVEPHLPPVDEPEVCTELDINMPTHLGVPWKGVIDLLRASVRPIILRDWKTISDFRYAKTPNELRRDVQLNSYAEYVFQELEAHDEDHGGVIDGGLIYLKTEKKKKDDDKNKSSKPKKPKKPKVLPVLVDLHRDVVREVWLSTRPVLDEMMAIAEIDDFNQVEPTTTSCDKYGGCPFRAKCGLEPRAPGLNPKKEKTVPSFIDKLKNKANQQQAEQKAEQPKTEQKAEQPKPEPEQKVEQPKASNGAAGGKSSGFLARARAQGSQQAQHAKPQGGQDQTAPPPTGGPAATIVPPDAPARDSNAALQSGDPGFKDDKGKSDEEVAAQDDANVEAEATSGKKRRKKSTTTNGAKKNGFVLYIDVIQVKGAGEIEPTTLEDWFSPIDMELSEVVKSENNLPSWWLLPFAEQKAALAMMVQQWIDKGLPPAMLVSSSSAITRDILPMLLPHATEVFRSLRG